MEIVWIVLITFAVLVSIALAAATAVTYFLRLRSREPFHVNLSFVTSVYLYVAIIAGLLVFTQGLSGLLRAGVAEVWGRDFSYSPIYLAIPEDRVVFAPDPLELRDPRTLTAVEQQALRQILADREASRLELEEKRQRLGLERAADEGLLEGVSFAIIGGVVLLAHVGGLRLLGAQSSENESLYKVYLAIATLVFGVIAIVSLPQAVFDTLRYALLDPINDFGRGYQPGAELALSIASTPLWLAFLWTLIRSVRDSRSDRPAESTPEAV